MENRQKFDKINLEGYYMKKCWINNKTILLTGASSGIGRELAIRLINNNNCKIIGIGRSEEKFVKLQQLLQDKSDYLEYHLMDVGVESSWIELANKLAGRKVDVIINNAGVLPPFESYTSLCSRIFDNSILSKDKGKTNTVIKDINTIENEIDKTLNTNFKSVAYSVAYMSQIIEKSSTPAIINIASSSALCALPGISIYSASKSAVKSFTECLMLERKYYVGLICPGFTKSDIFRYQQHSSENKLINMVATNLDKMTYKIYKAICKKKKRKVFGFDAKCMDKMYRLAPVRSPKIFGNILKKSKIELFEDVFNIDRKEN